MRFSTISAGNLNDGGNKAFRYAFRYFIVYLNIIQLLEVGETWFFHLPRRVRILSAVLAITIINNYYSVL